MIILDEAWKLLDGGGFHPFVFVTKYQQAEILLKMGSFIAAYDQTIRAREYFETKGLVAHYVRASLVMASALIENAKQASAHRKTEQSIRLQEAILLCKEIISQAHQYHLQKEMYKNYYLLGQIYALQENPTKTLRDYSAPIVHIERF